MDPGPLDEQHLRELAGAGRVELILITHRHADHTAAAASFHELTGAPVRAADARHCHGGHPLQTAKPSSRPGFELRVLATPGHTSDSRVLPPPRRRHARLSPDRRHHPGTRHHGAGFPRRQTGRLPGNPGQAGRAWTGHRPSRRTDRCSRHWMRLSAPTGTTATNGSRRSVPLWRSSAPAQECVKSRTPFIPTSIPPSGRQRRTPWPHSWITSGAEHAGPVRWQRCRCGARPGVPRQDG